MDLCDEGIYECTAGSQACTDPDDVDLDLCNGADDDCNGATADGADETIRARVVADYIAGMTDRFAIAEHERIA